MTDAETVVIPRARLVDWSNRIDSASDRSNDGASYAVCVEMRDMLNAAPAQPAKGEAVAWLVEWQFKDEPNSGGGSQIIRNQYAAVESLLADLNRAVSRTKVTALYTHPASEGLRHGPLTANDVPLLTPASQMMVQSYDNTLRKARLVETYDEPTDVLKVHEEGQTAPNCWAIHRFTYIGEIGADGWVTAPVGGWVNNPAPGQVVDVRGEHEAWPNALSECWSWDTITAFRLTGEQDADQIDDKPMGQTETIAQEALGFYADPISYVVTQASEPRSSVHGDGGRRAKEALSRIAALGD